MSVRRFDRSELRKATKTDNGWLRADAYLTRTGIFTYQRADGSTVKEYRPPDEVFAPESLETFELVPLTNDHPPRLLDAQNVKAFQVGQVGNIRRDGKFVRAQILVTDPATIAEMEAGKLEISAGYECDIDPTPGEVNGERYDAIQKSVRANHVAIVAKGRAGSDVKARLDSADAAMLSSELIEIVRCDDSEKESLKKIRLDGVEVEVPETAAQLIEKVLSAGEAALKAAESKSEQNAARADAAESELKKVKEEVASAPEKIRAELKARVELESKATDVLGEVKFDGLTDTEIQAKVVAEVTPELNTEGKSADYIAALFENALLRYAEKTGAASVLSAIHSEKRADSSVDVEEKYYQTVSNRWKVK